MLVTLDESVPRGDLLKYLRFRAAFLLSEVFHSTVRCVPGIEPSERRLAPGDARHGHRRQKCATHPALVHNA
jgi:hypothetical protein